MRRKHDTATARSEDDEVLGEERSTLWLPRYATDGFPSADDAALEIFRAGHATVECEISDGDGIDSKERHTAACQRK